MSDPESDWAEIRGRYGLEAEARGGELLRLTLLFAAGTIALALAVVPFAGTGLESRVATPLPAAGLDFTATGSIPERNAVRTYVIRRSVLQEAPSTPCIIPAGATRGPGC
jgi:hypothetical protein